MAFLEAAFFFAARKLSMFLETTTLHAWMVLHHLAMAWTFPEGTWIFFITFT